MSRINSSLPIFSLSRHENTLNKTSIYRGVYPIEFDSTGSDNENLSLKVLTQVLENSPLELNDKVIFTHGDLMETVGATNTLKVLTVTEKHVN